MGWRGSHSPISFARTLHLPFHWTKDMEKWGNRHSYRLLHLSLAGLMSLNSQSHKTVKQAARPRAHNQESNKWHRETRGQLRSTNSRNQLFSFLLSFCLSTLESCAHSPGHQRATGKSTRRARWAGAFDRADHKSSPGTCRRGRRSRPRRARACAARAAAAR